MQIVGDDDPLVITTERPRCVALEVDPSDLTAPSGEWQKLRNVAVHRTYGKTGFEQQAGMPAAAGRQVEHEAAWSDQRQKSFHPSRRWQRSLRNFTAYHHIR